MIKLNTKMNMFKTIAAAALITETADAAKSCRALAMSGGGSKGAFEAGAMWGLLKTDPNPEKYMWDVVTGVSAGSLNAAIVTGFAPGSEDEMVEYASDLWKNTGNSDAYENWWGGMFRGLTDKSGVYNNAAEYELVRGIIKELGDAKRKFVVSSVDVNTGNYVRFNETIPRDEQYKAFTASSLIPGVFETLKWKGHVLMDGGTVWNTNFVDAVERCREQVDNDSEITVDVIVCTGYDLKNNDQNSQDSYNNYLRNNEIKEYHTNMGDISTFVEAYPDINFRHYIQPSTPLASGLSMLDFSNNTNTWPMQAIGRTDGANAVAQGEGFMFAKMKEWNHSPELQAEYKTVG